MMELSIQERMEKLHDSLKEIGESESEDYPHCFYSRGPYDDSWSDDKLNQSPLGRFSEFVYDEANYPNIIKRFLNFYTYGFINPTDSVQGIVFDTIGIATTLQGPLWEVTTTESSCYNSTLPSEVVLQEGFGKPIRAVQFENAYNIYLLDHEYSSSSAMTVMRASLGYLALNFMTAVVKNESQINSTMMKNEFEEKFRALTGWPSGTAFSPPCKKCLNYLCERLKKNNKSVSTIFKMIVRHFVELSKSAVSSEKKDYLFFSVLTHTAMNGIGTIQQLQSICKIYDVTWEEIKERTTIDRTKRSWRRITTFYEKFVNKNPPEYGYPWARIIYDGYLRFYSPKDNVYLSLIFAGVLSVSQGEGVFSAHWIKKEKIPTPNGLTDMGKTLEKHLSKSRIPSENRSIESANLTGGATSHSGKD